MKNLINQLKKNPDLSKFDINICHLCNEKIEDNPVKNHCHYSGNILGFAHNECNLQYKFKKDNVHNVRAGIKQYKINPLFCIQKRCFRLLFGTQPTYDNSSFYETCARVRTYQENTSEKDYSLEHTKPLFNHHDILTIHHLYTTRSWNYTKSLNTQPQYH